MSQEQIRDFLKKHRGYRFTAPQLKVYLNQGISIYQNLKKIRERIDKKKEKEIKYDIISWFGRQARRYYIK
jgi:hypothetical protein